MTGGDRPISPYLPAPEDLDRFAPDGISYRSDQLRDWLYRTPVLSAAAMTNLPGAMRADLADRAVPLDSESLLRSVRLYLQARWMHLDEESVDVASPRELVHGLVTRLPLESVEKQALIETDTLDRRADLLRSYCELGSLKSTPETTRH